MSETQLQILQDKVLKLLAKNKELVDKIESMQADHVGWKTERAKLLKENEAARRQVNELIKQLRVLERNNSVQ